MRDQRCRRIHLVKNVNRLLHTVHKYVLTLCHLILRIVSVLCKSSKSNYILSRRSVSIYIYFVSLNYKKDRDIENINKTFGIVLIYGGD